MSPSSRHLVVTLSGQVVLTSTLTRAHCTIGRLPENDLVLPDAQVAPHHAEIRVADETAALTDLDGSTGTIVNGVRLLPQQPHALPDGARIQIGPYEIVFRAPAAEARAETQAPVAVEESADEDVRPRTDAAVLPFQSQRTGGPPAASAAPDGTSAYLEFLPIIFHEHDFLARYLRIFEAIWEPLEQRQDHIGLYFSPRTCPASWLPWFASWFGLELNPHWPEARVRALLAEAPELYRWRGTRYGLTRMLEVCTGATLHITEHPEQPFVFHITVRMPPHADADAEQTLEELIKAHKPAHTGYVLEVQR